MKVYIRNTNVISPLGITTMQNLDKILAGKSGVTDHVQPRIHSDPIHASLIPTDFTDSENTPTEFSRYEQLLATTIAQLIKGASILPTDPEVLFLFSSTKGNISRLEELDDAKGISEDISIVNSANKITDYFNHPNPPEVISNACISGVAAILYGKRMIEMGKFKHVIISGADLVSKFIFSGFHSFQALSPAICKPFSSDRDGINLGEAAASIILSAEPPSESEPIVLVEGGAITNDANHISGPSRTGEPLAKAIQLALDRSEISSNELSFISAHGTATPYNDQMEAQAIHLVGLADKPIHSLKAIYGHTLGAAGLVESNIGIQAMIDNWILPSRGFSSQPMSPSLVIHDQPIQHQGIRGFLKTASGFGGCNAALVFSKQL